MQLSSAEVLKVAKLARFYLPESQLDSTTDQLGRIVEMVQLLSTVPTDGVEPMAHALDVHSVVRLDVLSPSLDRQAALSNAPQRDDECFRVPPVIGHDH